MFKLTSVRADMPTSTASCWQFFGGLNIYLSSIRRFSNYGVIALLVSCRHLRFLLLARLVLSDLININLLTMSEKYFYMAHLIWHI